MSDLRHLTLDQLFAAKRNSEKMIGIYGSKMAGERSRLEWIQKYIKEKMPVIPGFNDD